MTGHARQRGDSWELKVFAGRDPLTNGKKYLYRTVKATGRKQAEKQLAAFVTEVDGQHAGPAGTFGDLLERWFETCSHDWSPGTARYHRWLIDSRLVGLKGYDLRRVTTADLDAFYAALRARGGAAGGPLAASSVVRTHSVVRSALEQAIAWGWRDDNPAARAKPGKLDPTTIRPPSPDQVRTLANAASLADPDVLLFVALDAETGARRAELAALRWSDFTGIASVRIARALTVGEPTPENLRRYAGHIWPSAGTRGRPSALIEKPTPKNRHSIRTLALSSGMVALLAEHHTRNTARAMAAGVALPADAFVFGADLLGTRPLRPDTWTHRFSRLRATVGLETVRLHDLRHYVATTLLNAGVDLTTVAGRLGHGGGGKTTLAIYGHFLEGGETDRAAAELMAEIRTRPPTAVAVADRRPA